MTKTNKMKRLVLIIVIWLIDMLRWLVSVFSTEIIALASSLKAYVYIIYSSKKKISEAIGAFLEQMIIAELFSKLRFIVLVSRELSEKRVC